jgi:hypothetical protein
MLCISRCEKPKQLETRQRPSDENCPQPCITPLIEENPNIFASDIGNNSAQVQSVDQAFVTWIANMVFSPFKRLFVMISAL